MNEVYTPATVSRLLENYWYIRALLVSGTPRASNDPVIYTTENTPKRTRQAPLGYSSTDSWPFSVRKHASPVRDARQKGRRNEEWLVSLVDIEAVLDRLSDDDLRIVNLYFFQGYTAEEVASTFGLSNAQAMRRRIDRVVGRITRMLNNETT